MYGYIKSKVKQRVEPGSRVVLEALSPQTRYFINVVGVKENRQTPTLETSFITPQVLKHKSNYRKFNFVIICRSKT